MKTKILNKKTVWTIGSFVLIIFGACIGYFNGYLPMQNEENNVNRIEISNTEMMLSNHPPPFIQKPETFPQRTESNGWVDNLDINIAYPKTILFVTDNVDLAISGVVPAPSDIIEIYIMLVDSHKQVQQSYNLSEAYREIDDTIPNSPVIELKPKVNQTNKEIIEFEPVAFKTQPIHVLDNGFLPSFIFFSEGDKIAQIFVMHSSGKVESKLDTEPFFTIYPDSARLQVTTNINLLKQINQSSQEIKFQNKTDTDIVSLSWIAIAIAPIVIGSDILLRIYLEPNADKISKESLFHSKSTS